MLPLYILFRIRRLANDNDNDKSKMRHTKQARVYPAADKANVCLRGTLSLSLFLSLSVTAVLSAPSSIVRSRETRHYNPRRVQPTATFDIRFSARFAAGHGTRNRSGTSFRVVTASPTDIDDFNTFSCELYKLTYNIHTFYPVMRSRVEVIKTKILFPFFGAIFVLY